MSEARAVTGRFPFNDRPISVVLSDEAAAIVIIGRSRPLTKRERAVLDMALETRDAPERRAMKGPQRIGPGDRVRHLDGREGVAREIDPIEDGVAFILVDFDRGGSGRFLIGFLERLEAAAGIGGGGRTHL